MRPLGALLVLLGGGRRTLLARGQTALDRAGFFHGTAKLHHLDRAIQALTTLRNGRRFDPEATLLFSTALMQKITVLPPAQRASFRARGIAALQLDLRHLRAGQGLAIFALETLLSQLWMPLPDEDQHGPEALGRLIRARDAQARAIAACPGQDPGQEDAVLAARVQLAALDLRLAEHPLCPDRAAQSSRLAHDLPELAAVATGLATRKSDDLPQSLALLNGLQDRLAHLSSPSNP